MNFITTLIIMFYYFYSLEIQIPFCFLLFHVRMQYLQQWWDHGKGLTYSVHYCVCLIVWLGIVTRSFGNFINSTESVSNHDSKVVWFGVILFVCFYLPKHFPLWLWKNDFDVVWQTTGYWYLLTIYFKIERHPAVTKWQCRGNRLM